MKPEQEWVPLTSRARRTAGEPLTRETKAQERHDACARYERRVQLRRVRRHFVSWEKKGGARGRRTLMNTSAVLFSCMKGRPAGDQRPWTAMGTSSAMCRRNIMELRRSR